MENIDKTWKGFYRLSGILWFLLMVLFVAAGVCDFIAPVNLQNSTSEKLQAMSQSRFVMITGNSIYLANDILSIIALLGIYFSLKEVGKIRALTGLILIILAAIIELFVRIIFHAAIAMSSQSILPGAGNPDAISWADLVFEIYNSGLFLVVLLWGSGSMMLGWAMLSGIYSKITAWLYMVAGSLLAAGSFGYIFSPDILALMLPAVPLIIIASVLAGLRLIAIDREIT